MHFVLQTPSLKHLAGVKIVAHLWNQPDIFTQINQSLSHLPAMQLNEHQHKLIEIEEKVKSKVWALPLPETCNKELLKFIKPIGMEIIVWCNYHNLDGYAYKYLPRQFCWSMHGTVDYKKTAESMVKFDERLSVERRFEVACLNCLEDEARKWIDWIPYQQIREYISAAVRNQLMDQGIMVAYLACSLTGDEDLLNTFFQDTNLGIESINQYLFNVVLRGGTRATCEYFFQKVSQEENQQVSFYLPFRSQQSPTCGLMYYLSLLNEEQQQRMFQESLAVLLIFFLRWPMQSLFVETAKRMWQLMGGVECAEVLSLVITKIRTGLNDYDYAQLFWELWRSSPAEHKHHFLDDMYRLEYLIATKRKEFIQLVFNEAPSHLLNEIVERQNFYDQIIRMLMDEGVISDAALMECKERAALISSKDRDNEEKRQRSQHVSRLVDMVMERRISSRENAQLATSRWISIGRVTRGCGDGEKRRRVL